MPKALQSERAFAIEYLAREKTLQTSAERGLGHFEASMKNLSLPYSEYAAANKIVDLKDVQEYEKSPDYFYSTAANLRYLIQRMTSIVAAPSAGAFARSSMPCRSKAR